MPFPDEAFDRVVSTFGAMFAPDHERAAAELVRVCRPGGRVAMTTWVTDGYAGEIFKLTGAFLPPPPPGVQPPPLWGVESHVELTFGSEQDAVDEYMNTFGPFVTARTVLEPQGRWPEFVQAFADIVRRFNLAADGSARIQGEYLLVAVDR
jgi:SAM-dependent methyltransferase